MSLFGEKKKSGIIVPAVCVENYSKGGDAIMGKHTMEQEKPNSNPGTSGGDFAGISRYMDFF